MLGHHVEEKTKFCRKVGIITQDEFVFIATGHKYRNELYHVGIRHDDMIYALAWQYHELACDLFVKLKPRAFGWGPNLQISETAKTHWPERGRPCAERFGRKPKLDSEKPVFRTDFVVINPVTFFWA